MNGDADTNRGEAHKTGSPQPQLVRPEFIQMELNTVCNMRCEVCPLMLDGPREPLDVDPEEYFSIFQRNFAAPYFLIISGFSEALLCPGLLQIIAWEKKRGNQVFLGTNGKLLNGKLLEDLLDLEVDQFVVSMDSLDREVYQGLRHGQDLDELLERVGFVQERILARKSRTRLVINSVVTRSTAPLLPELVERLAEMGIGELALIKVMRMGDLTSAYLEREYLSWDQYNDLDLNSLVRRASELGIHAIMSDRSVLREDGCRIPETGFYINADFDVSPCPYASFDRRYVFGNLRAAHIREIFGSSAYQEFRAAFQDHGHLPVCEDCACMFSEGVPILTP